MVSHPNSVCNSCYALKGRYVFPNVVQAQEKRFASLKDPRWVDAMVYLIRKRKCTYFRWHDSGDLQGIWHLENIAEVARQCPETQFWLPTRERAILKFHALKYGALPPNLVVRLSSSMIDAPPVSGFLNTSTVVTDPNQATCPAYKQGGKCQTCRACWDPAVQNVAYLKH